MSVEQSESDLNLEEEAATEEYSVEEEEDADETVIEQDMSTQQDISSQHDVKSTKEVDTKSQKTMEVVYFGEDADEEEEEEEEEEEFTEPPEPVNPELETLRNLTPNQIKALVEENEKEIEVVKGTIGKIRAEIEIEEREECDVFKRCEKEQRICVKRLQMQEEEIYLEQLKERTALLKSVKTKYQPFPVSKLPQVILCSPWTDSIPKVVVCSRPKKPVEEPSKLDAEFARLFSPEQLELIEKEKKWMEVMCGQLQVQVAGVKGKMRVLGRENNVLKAVVHDVPVTQEPFEVRFPDEKCVPCQRTNTGKTRKCPAYSDKGKRPIIVNIDAKTMTYEDNVAFKGSCKEELEDLERKVQELQDALDKAKEKADTLKAQRDLVRCLKESLEEPKLVC